MTTNTITKASALIKRAAQAATKLERNVSQTALTQSPVTGDLGNDVFKRLRPVAEKLLASGGQTYGQGMPNVIHESKQSPAQRAEAFRARYATNLAGRTGLVTGAAGNIGSETAFMMAQHKMNIMLTDIPLANLDSVAETCELLGAPKVEVSKHDLTDEEGREALIGKTLSTVGSPFASALCAGVYFEGGLWDVNPSTRAIKARNYAIANKVNVESPVALAEGLAPHLNPGSHMLVVNSLAGETGVPGESMYVGTKHALDGFWQTMAKEYGNLGIKFEQVFPSALLGKMADGREGLEAELLHYPLAAVRAIEAAFTSQGNSYFPSIRVNGTISPYARDHGG